MVKTPSFPPSSEDSAERVAVEAGSDEARLPAGFTLRVKPDRRREQLPIPAELDRRRRG
jgi:hypothetical protein